MFNLRQYKKPKTAIMVTGQLRIFPNIEKKFFENIKYLQKFTDVILFFNVSHEFHLAPFHIEDYAKKNNISFEESEKRHIELYPTISNNEFINIVNKYNIPYYYKTYTQENITDEEVLESIPSDISHNEMYSVKSSKIQIILERTCIENVVYHANKYNIKFDHVLRMRPDYLFNKYGIHNIKKYYMKNSNILVNWNMFYLYPYKFVHIHFSESSKILSQIKKYQEIYKYPAVLIPDIIFKIALTKNKILYSHGIFGNVFPIKGRCGN